MSRLASSLAAFLALCRRPCALVVKVTSRMALLLLTLMLGEIAHVAETVAVTESLTCGNCSRSLPDLLPSEGLPLTTS
ncbi:MAG: hypothetical protein K0S45_488 [Nitrospira sp.]|jgi:hypothetical protein|nr:hypothetical protein [Nitrospira sp.]